jgi:hypothetical protein
MLLFNAIAQSQRPVDSALESLLGTDSSTLPFDLDRSRPAPDGPGFRAHTRGLVPEQGWIKNLTEAQRKKMTVLEPILRVHERQEVYEIRVYRGRQASVSSRFGTVVLITEPALRLLDPPELQALVAHEIGHEYVWPAIQEADKRQDLRRHKELELFCDGVAILTLRRAGVDPKYLLSGLEKMLIFNLTWMRRAPGPATHPSFEERKKFFDAMNGRSCLPLDRQKNTTAPVTSTPILARM